VSRRFLALLASLVVTLAVAGAPAGAVSTRAHQPSLQFIGQAIIPTGTTFAGTTVGGLSSITYDASRRASTRSASTSARASAGATCTSTP
jgi:hypothetical protein